MADVEAPVFTAPAPVSQDNDSGICGAVVDLTDPAVTDNCEVASLTNDAPSVFPVGTTVVTWTATDIHANSAEITQDVTVADVEAPILVAPAPVSQDNDSGICGAVVDLADPAVSDNCEVATLTNDAPAVFPVGTTVVTWTATDVNSNSAEITQEVTVIDAEAPILVVTDEIKTLWPPNHKYQTILLSDLLVSVSDNCGIGINGVFIKSVSSDEPEDAKGNGDGKTKNDIVISGDCSSVDLRAERSGNGNGRIYEITLSVSDDSRNESTAVCYVQVPHNKKASSVFDGSEAGYTVFSGCSDKSEIILRDKTNSDYMDITLKSYPNPFSYSTEIEFYLPEDSDVKLRIYDLSGKIIRDLIDKDMNEGLVRQSWNGCDSNGNRLPSGLYFAILQTRNGLARTSIILSH